MATYGAKTKSAVRRAFVIDNKPVSLIAEEFSIPERTIWNWKKAALKSGDDWEKEQALTLMGGEGESSLIYATVPKFMRLMNSVMESVDNDKEMDALKKAELLSRLSDALTKTTSALRRLNPGVDKLALGVEFVSMLTQFVARNFPRHAPAMQEILEPFSKELLARLES